MSSYLQVSIQASVLLHCVILRSLGQMMPCTSSQVRWNCLLMPGCVNPVPFFRILMYMITADASNSNRFNVNYPCHSEGIIHRHARPFLLYPPMPYSQASNHSVTDGLKKIMLLIGTLLVVTCSSNFLHSWRSS